MPKIQWKTGVYQIRNVVNGKVYVGSAARDFTARLRLHRNVLNRNSCYNRHLQGAWNKYGSSCFEFTILERCQPSLCLDREEHWIATLRATDASYGYNICQRAKSRLGVKSSKETCKKISASKIGKKRPPHVGEAVRIANLTRVVSNKTRAKMSIARLGRVCSPTTRQKISNAHRGRVLTKEQREQLSDSHRGQTPWNLGKKASDETREKQSLAQKRRFARERSKE